MTGRRFGFECEITGGTAAVLEHLHDNGLLAEPYLHEYHCHCEDCDPHSEWAFHAQEDCTVDGEIILNVHEHGSERADKAFAGLAAALRAGRATVGTRAGFHVHVSHEDMDGAAKARLLRMFIRYQGALAELAAASFSDVRNYNQPLPLSQVSPGRPEQFWGATDEEILTGTVTYGQPYRGYWLADTPYDTYEFRLWNATKTEWRMRLAVGVSVAMVDAAADGVNVLRNDPRPLEAVIGDYMDEAAWAGVLRQRFARGGLLDGSQPSEDLVTAGGW